MKYSIGIVTFVSRFEQYFQPLIKSIKDNEPETEVVVCVNGEHNVSFDENYRCEILKFLSHYPAVYPMIFTQFRSLAKLWNTCLINSTNDHVLLLNDDLTVHREFFDGVDSNLNHTTMFKINGSWSHAMIDRRIIEELGWFDERLLGVGEEDGDMQYRWEKKFQQEFPVKWFGGVHNHVEHNGVLNNIRKTNSKYSAFNREFIFNQKYDFSDSNGFRSTLFGQPATEREPNTQQYPYERFFWENRGKL